MESESVVTQQLRRAFASTRTVLAEVRPSQLDAATPCVSWDVRALINHFVGSGRWGAAMVLGTESADKDYAAGDLLASYDDSRRVALAAFGSAGVLEKTIELPFGRFSGTDLMNMVTRDQFTHGWDLARAIGQPTDLDSDLATELLAQAHLDILDTDRGPEGRAIFGPATKPSPPASPADQLAAFLGRTC
ncbi:TIGR03086 family metal-binding protein [Kribbella sp. NBC_00709]|uniref:TIGR03086 family metal-binding protein n=1 Tax=Kribbella sp. NBC_00709 TaxID=2975972 RepID=UPI002E2847BB|nr:TIGR03086 family metal-binding protein [Kribbella sp. NBC_00709]